MKAIKSFFAAVSMYSRIPVPQFEWHEEDMKYIFCFFPWIGAFIGGGIYLWNYLCGIYHIGSLCRIAIGVCIPLFITGGIHVDGFMDTMDAMNSFSPKERKLEILKDSHIGAFAVIMLILYGLIFLGSFSEIDNDILLRIVCSGFFLSRCLCGISAVSFQLAKSEGMLYRFTDSAATGIVKGFLYIQTVFCIGFMLSCSVTAGLLVTVAALSAFAYYFYRSKKEFGGVTGDTSGYFVLLCEICMIAVAAAVNIFIWR